MAILLYGCTTWTLTKHMERKLDGNCTRMLWAVLNKSWRQNPIKQQQYGHLPSISKTIQIRQARHGGHYWRSMGELISDVPLWTPSHGQARVGLEQCYTDTGCSMEDLPRAMDNRDKWWKRVRKIHAGGMPWWWWSF